MKRKIVALVVIAVAIAAVAVWWLAREGVGSGDGIVSSGTVEATEADLGFQAGGRIAEIGVHEGDVVAAGAVVARLDAAELEARRLAAAAQLASARALLAELERGSRPQEVNQAAAALAAARERSAEADRVFARTQRLYEGGAVSREALDQASTAQEVAQAQYRQAREQHELVRQGARQERIDAQRAAVQQAEASLAQVDATLDNAVVRAPFPGIVTRRHREPGEVIGPGLPVVTVMNPADRWVRIYVRQDRIGRIGIGQEAEIRADSYRDRRYEGRVTFISSQAEFTPRNVQTEEERVKLVYAVKVSVRDDADLDLRPGVPADVRLGAKPERAVAAGTER